MSTNAIVPGSLTALAQQSGMSIAESFMQADVVILVDVSSSMSENDSRGGQSRYEVAMSELTKLQASIPGKIAVISFSTGVQFCPGGVPVFSGGSTALTKALQFVQVADGLVRFIVVSDGCPDDTVGALDLAATFTSQIDTVYVGPESDVHGGRLFLERLARARGGQAVTAKCADQLAERVQTLLLNGA
jgi:hypothetical protein